ncbi:hypothetical protein SUGI_1190780 [Cryptomeria japonica]|nr:hypothetical protein SUGI_1190780 [Cryptomeria japonica]
MAYINNFISCFLSLLRLRRPPQDESYLWSESQENLSPTLGQMIKKRLPVITFRNIVAEKVMSEIEEDFVCAVCLISFKEDDEIRELCNCSHIFHRICLDKWIDKHEDTCPLCRCPLLPPPESGDGETDCFESYGTGPTLQIS